MENENVDLLFQHLFLPELDTDDLLCESVYSDASINKANASGKHPVAELFQRAAADQLAKISDDGGWDEPISTAAPLVKREADLDFSDIAADARARVARMKQEWGIA